MLIQQLTSRFNKVFSLLFFCFLSCSSTASSLDLLILSNSKESVGNVGISITPKTPEKHLSNPQPQVMDQKNTQFVPHILMAQKGAKISFPNSDNVKHHVYSFSDAKTFEVQLYKDKKPQPLAFDKEGTVTLGCNIHDWMLAYIYIVDTPYFNKTNTSGLAHFELPDGEYTIQLHSPLLQGGDKVYSADIVITGNKSETITLSSPLISTESNVEVDEFDVY